jgi:hypothetical protein
MPLVERGKEDTGIMFIKAGKEVQVNPYLAGTVA